MLLDCKYNEGTATLTFDEWEFFITCDHKLHTAPAVYDFTLFAAVIIGMTNGVDVELDVPVSRSALNNVEKIQKAFSCWQVNKIHTCNIICNNIVEEFTSPREQPFNAICLSGGVDSTYALLTSQTSLKITHGLLVHGADYTTSDTKGFGELYERVAKICDKAGIELIVVKTNFRKLKFNYKMFHIIMLAMSMHFIGRNFATVAFAADNTIYQDFVRYPWGSNKFIGDHLSGSSLNVEYCGYESERSEKIDKIVADGRFLENLSVCFANRSTGGNCGKCLKCIQTYLNLEFAGADASQIFEEVLDPLKSLKLLAVPDDVLEARGFYLRVSEIYKRCPAGELKDTLNQIVKRSYSAAKLADGQVPKITKWKRRVNRKMMNGWKWSTSTAYKLNKKRLKS